MAYNPRFKITIEYKEGNEEWIEIMKQEFKDRLINQRKLYDFFAILEKEETEENMVIIFSPYYYVKQKEYEEEINKAFKSFLEVGKNDKKQA